MLTAWHELCPSNRAVLGHRNLLHHPGRGSDKEFCCLCCYCLVKVGINQQVSSSQSFSASPGKSPCRWAGRKNLCKTLQAIMSCPRKVHELVRCSFTFSEISLQDSEWLFQGTTTLFFLPLFSPLLRRIGGCTPFLSCNLFTETCRRFKHFRPFTTTLRQ